MELLFSLSPTVQESHREILCDAVRSAVPGSTVQLDRTGAYMRVVLPTGADVAVATDAVSLRALHFGITATCKKRDDGFVPITNTPQSFQRPPVRMMRLSSFVVALIAVALAVAIVVFGFSALLFGLSYNPLGNKNEVEDYAAKIDMVDAIFDQYALYDIDGQLLLDEMLHAYAAATGDPYAAYYTEEEFRRITAESEGRYVGIGVSIAFKDQLVGIYIEDVMRGSPAENAGVKPGDVIVAFGEGAEMQAVADIGYAAALDALHGEAGSKVTFRVHRGAAIIDFTITRAEISSVTVWGAPSVTDPTVGIVCIRQFDLVAPVQFMATMDDLIARGCTKFVFDVRDNPGGDTKSVAAILATFLNPQDVIYSTVTKDGTTTYYRAEPVSYKDSEAGCDIKAENIGKYRAYKTAVLVDGGTASAAELFTATLRDYRMTTVVGTKTYGKGVYQYVISLDSFGYDGALRLTAGYYNPASGTNYHGVGVLPTEGYTVELSDPDVNFRTLSEAEDVQLQRAITACQVK